MFYMVLLCLSVSLGVFLFHFLYGQVESNLQCLFYSIQFSSILIFYSWFMLVLEFFGCGPMVTWAGEISIFLFLWNRFDMFWYFANACSCRHHWHCYMRLLEGALVVAGPPCSLMIGACASQTLCKEPFGQPSQCQSSAEQSHLGELWIWADEWDLMGVRVCGSSMVTCVHTCSFMCWIF